MSRIYAYHDHDVVARPFFEFRLTHTPYTQIADLTHNTRAPVPAEAPHQRENSLGVQRLEAQLKDAAIAQRRTNEQLAQMHAQVPSYSSMLCSYTSF